MLGFTEVDILTLPVGDSRVEQRIDDVKDEGRQPNRDDDDKNDALDQIIV